VTYWSLTENRYAERFGIEWNRVDTCRRRHVGRSQHDLVRQVLRHGDDAERRTAGTTGNRHSRNARCKLCRGHVWATNQQLDSGYVHPVNRPCCNIRHGVVWCSSRCNERACSKRSRHRFYCRLPLRAYHVNSKIQHTLKPSGKPVCARGHGGARLSQGLGEL